MSSDTFSVSLLSLVVHAVNNNPTVNNEVNPNFLLIILKSPYAFSNIFTLKYIIMLKLSCFLYTGANIS
ncbi:hypothetical protein B795N_11710 [Marinilactibacillus psychrotolerans]|nr:hypothetical protein MPS01_21280 [Marinilactibacillus psychrotolerans]GEQ33289.1 hypothetical protein B795N_11710 [Marinilactibacillus psychrotolerans]